jgi:hypothetical protein
MEMNLTYSNWTAPALEYLNFATNCTLVGQFAHTWYSGEQGINDRVGAAYFEAALPPDLKGKVTAGQLLDWSQAAYASAWNHSYSNGSNVYIEFVLNRPQAACPKDFCRGIPYQGIPDLLGVGVSISVC